MAEKFRYVCQRPTRLIYASVTQKSAPVLENGQAAEAKFNGTFGLEEVDYKAIIGLEVDAIKSEMGEFSGKADDYYLACTSGKKAAARTLAAAEFKAKKAANKGDHDKAMKIKEKAEARAAIFSQYAGIMVASSKFDVECARLENGKIIDLDLSTDQNRALAAKEWFYPGAYVVPSVALQGFERKKAEDRDGVTAFLQNCMFVGKGKKMGGMAPANKEVFGGYTDYDPTALAPSDGGLDAATDKNAVDDDDEFAGMSGNSSGGKDVNKAFNDDLDDDVPF